MSVNISGKNDVFKFALALYDYLLHKGNTKEANELSLLVDSCYPNDTDALGAHLEAFRQIQNSAPALPQEYQQALEEAIAYIAKELDNK